jgi:hypothetical protein
MDMIGHIYKSGQMIIMPLVGAIDGFAQQASPTVIRE